MEGEVRTVFERQRQRLFAANLVRVELLHRRQDDGSIVFPGVYQAWASK